MDYKLTFYGWRDGLKADKFLGLKCKDCGAVTFPPRKVCSKCDSENMDIIEVSNKGKILSYTVCNVAPRGFTGPFIVALAELEQGCHIMANVLDVDPLNIKEELIGKKVEMGYQEIAGDYMTGGDNRYPLTLKIIN